jgi:hypothetical protein
VSLTAPPQTSRALIAVEPIETLTAPLDHHWVSVDGPGDFVSSHRAVAMRDDVLVVRGLRCTDETATTCAITASIFERDGETFVPAGEFEFGARPWTTTADRARFDNSIAITSDFIFIGDPAHRLSTTDDGVVHVVRREAEGWAHTNTWTRDAFGPAVGSVNTAFGYALAADDETLVIGAPCEGESGCSPGAVYVFRFFDGEPTFVERIERPSSGTWAGTAFGGSIAVSGDTVVISTTRYEEGSVFLFGVDDAGLTYRQRLPGGEAVYPIESSIGFVRLFLSSDQLVVVSVRGGNRAINRYNPRAGWWVPTSFSPYIQGNLNLKAGFTAYLGASAIFADDSGYSTSIDLYASSDGQFEHVSEVEVWQTAGEHSGALAMGANRLVVADRESTTVHVFALRHGNGASCSDDASCIDGFCRDGVCCDGACGDGDSTDCMACSVASGAIVDGVCGASNGNVCGPDDGDVCTQDTCVDGVCAPSELTCDDGDPCTASTCDPTTGCVFSPLDDGTSCDDGDACTTVDTCTAGTCGGTTLDCDDEDPETRDVCDDVDGCKHARVGDPSLFRAIPLQTLHAPFDRPWELTGTWDALPRAVAIRGDVLAVRGRRCDEDYGEPVMCAVSLSIFERSTADFELVAEFTFSARASISVYDYFSRFDGALAVSRDHVFVGEPTDINEWGEDSVVHVVRRGESGWVHSDVWNDDGVDMALLDGVASGFGYAIAADGDSAVVGALCEDSDEGDLSHVGALYVYRQQSGEWSLVEKRRAEGPLSSAEHFGGNVALLGNTLVASTQHPRTLSVYAINNDGAIAPTQVIDVSLDNGIGPVTLTPSHIVTHHQVWAVSSSQLESYALVDGSYALSSSVTFENDLEGSYGAWKRPAFAAAGDIASVVSHPTTGPRLDLLSWTDDGWVTGLEVTDWPSSPETSVSLAMSEDVLVVADRETTEVYVYVLDRSLGAPCSDDAQCTRGFCRDGVCCHNACGDGNVDDCLACSVAMGAPRDGVCAPSTGNTCPDGDDDICTVATCTDGQCASAPLACDDENPCTLDSCGSEGCVHTNIDDDTPCVNGTCTDGKCAPVDVSLDGGARVDGGIEEPVDAGAHDDGGARVDGGDATTPECTCGASSSSDTAAHAALVLCLMGASVMRKRVNRGSLKRT